MTYHPDIHHRCSLRLQNYDYAQAGAYFVTVCTQDRECLFGEVVAGEMRLNGPGEVVADEWLKSGEIRHEIALDEWVVMPNHLHGIVVITNVSTGGRGDRPVAPTAPQPLPVDAMMTGLKSADRPIAPAGPQPRSVGAMMAGFKSAVTKRINAMRVGAMMAGFKSAVTKRINAMRGTPGLPVWQRNYYEHIIRNEDSLNRIRDYIINNPLQWALDRENPANAPGSGRT